VLFFGEFEEDDTPPASRVTFYFPSHVLSPRKVSPGSKIKEETFLKLLCIRIIFKVMVGEQETVICKLVSSSWRLELVAPRFRRVKGT